MKKMEKSLLAKPDNRNKAVEFIDINFAYTENLLVLKNINFSVYENEYVCIVGHNGSGKSTISKVLTGLLQPKSGIIKLFGEPINNLNIKHLRDNIGIVFQNPDNQFIGLTAEDDIAFGLENRKVEPKKMLPIINEVAKIVNIEDLLTKESHTLSGGQKQRVAIASVLAINPKVIIFDESTSMLDPKAKNQLKELMLILKTEFKKTVISITHDMEEVINADRVIIMEEGMLVKDGDPKVIFTDQKFLKELKLDIPFILQLTKMLSEKNQNINSTLDFGEAIKQICSALKK